MIKDWLLRAKYSNYNFVKSTIDKVVETLPLDNISQKSTRGNNSKQYKILEEKIDLIINDYSYFLNNLPQLKEKLNGKKLKFLSSWLVCGNEGSYHTLHQHNPSTDGGDSFTNTFNIATVLYLDVPKHNSTDSFDLEGDMYFMTLRDGYIKKNVITPEEGDFIIMPTYLWHGVYPQKKGLRRTLNMDFEVVDYEN